MNYELVKCNGGYGIAQITYDYTGLIETDYTIIAVYDKYETAKFHLNNKLDLLSMRGY